MHIIAKTGLEENQVKDKVGKLYSFAKKTKRVGGLELHTLENDYINLNTLTRKVLDIYNIYDTNILVIHMPLATKYELEGILDKNNYKVFDKTCEIAQRVAELQNINVEVVIHFASNVYTLKEWGLLNQIASSLLDLVTRYKNIRLNFENLMPLVKAKGVSVSRSNYTYETKELVEYLLEYSILFNKKNIGITLDTCHALASIKLFKELGNPLFPSVNLLDYFVELSPYVNVVHLADIRGFGYNQNHGIEFKYVEDLHIILDYIQEQLKEGVLVTVEMQELDYTDSKNFQNTVTDILNYIEK